VQLEMAGNGPPFACQNNVEYAKVEWEMFDHTLKLVDALVGGFISEHIRSWEELWKGTTRASSSPALDDDEGDVQVLNGSWFSLCFTARSVTESPTHLS
jgi:hypothetical protein